MTPTTVQHQQSTFKFFPYVEPLPPTHWFSLTWHRSRFLAGLSRGEVWRKKGSTEEHEISDLPISPVKVWEYVDPKGAQWTEDGSFTFVWSFPSMTLLHRCAKKTDVAPPSQSQQDSTDVASGIKV